MSDNVPATIPSHDIIDELRLRAETLERQLAEVEQAPKAGLSAPNSRQRPFEQAWSISTD